MAQQRSSLRVEGGDDLHAILHLLIRNGIDYDQQPWPSWFPSIEEVRGGKTGVLDNVERLVRASSNGRIGFVLDADDSVRDTWRAMRSRLRRVGLDPPPAIPPQGFAGESTEYGARVGVWLTPDNQQEGEHGEGTLERFLEALVREADPLWPYAGEATRQAKAEHGARYGDSRATRVSSKGEYQQGGVPQGTSLVRDSRRGGPGQGGCGVASCEAAHRHAARQVFLKGTNRCDSFSDSACPDCCRFRPTWISSTCSR